MSFRVVMLFLSFLIKNTPYTNMGFMLRHTIRQKNHTIKYQWSLLYLLPIDPTSFLGTLICLLIVVFCFKKYLSFWKELLIIILYVGLIFYLPNINFIFMLFISGIILLFCIPYFDFFFPLRTKITSSVWVILQEMGLISYFLELYDRFFSQEIMRFRLKITIIYLFCLIYILISKYLWLNQKHLIEMDLFSFYLLFVIAIISLFAFYLRFLLNIAILVATLEPVYRLNVEGLDENAINKNHPQSSTSHKSLLSFNRYDNSHHHYTVSKNAMLFRRVGIFIGVGTLGIASYAAYQQALQTIAAQESVRAQEQNNFEMSRQNDLEEVAQGFMSKETYESKYKKIK